MLETLTELIDELDPANARYARSSAAGRELARATPADDPDLSTARANTLRRLDRLNSVLRGNG